MTTPAFLAWLERKTAPYQSGKLVPPVPILAEQLREHLKGKMRQHITEEVLRQADVDGRVARACAALETDVEQRLVGIGREVYEALQVDPTQHWRAPIDRVAAELVLSGITMMN